MEPKEGNGDTISTTPLLPTVFQLMDLIIFNFESTGKVILKTKEELYKQGILFLLWSPGQ